MSALSGQGAARFLARPDPGSAGALLHGADAARVAVARKDLVAALAGPEAEAEMRLTRLSAQEVRADPAAATDALKAVGFFPGPRVVVVEGLTEGQAAPVLAALDAWAEGDAALVATAGALKKTSKLRKAFEAHRKAVAIAFYDDPMDGAELARLVEAEGLALTAEGRRAVEAYALAMGPAEFRQLLGVLALYADGAEIGPDAVAALAPASLEAGADAVIAAAAEGQAAAIGPLMARLAAQGVGPVTLVIAATRHFQALHMAAVGGGVGGLRPPVYGPRRAAMERQLRAWGARRLEGALAVLMETDLVLRSAAPAPGVAVMERALIRLAMMVRG